ncbi:MAG: cupredoxin family copper-binding protein [Dehalococcoidia bacterium]
MSSRAPLVPIGLIIVSLVALAVFSGAMMTSMMGDGHWGMMGGRGSDPGDEAPVTGVSQVRLEDFAFAPANIIVPVGTTVTWTNYDSAGHTVTSDDGDELDSPLFARGASFSHTFNEPGEYAYHCEPHPNMKGLVTVTGSEAKQGP